MISTRKRDVLKIIVDDYVATATPVASETIARSYGLRISPATVRNEMASLEEQGYIARPHISAGAVPCDKGYRYYVEELPKATELPLAEHLMLQHLFHQIERELEEWTRLAATMLARLAHNAAMITFPKSFESRFKRIDLTALQEFVALLILILRGVKIRQQLLTFKEAVSEEMLERVTNKLNASYVGLTSQQISGMGDSSRSPLEQQVTKAVVEIMKAEDQQQYEEPHLEGIHHMLSQPEFARSEKVLPIMEAIEEKTFMKSLLIRPSPGSGIQVFIGKENIEQAMHQCSLVITGYGVPGEVSGVIGVVGPTRMQYRRIISAVAYFCSLMTGMIRELYS